MEPRDDPGVDEGADPGEAAGRREADLRREARVRHPGVVAQQLEEASVDRVRIAPHVVAPNAEWGG
ncbi:hypothetical protein GCM10009840_11420 [Pseudolysinimonas kribbensis]